MIRIFSSLFFILFFIVKISAQTGTDFWFAPPEVTEDHNPPGGEPIFVMVTSQGAPATVTISQPANPGFNGGSPIIVSLGANQSSRVNLSAFKSILETQPTDMVLSTGLRIQATATISAYYEISNTNNPDIFALKGANGLGYEFYIPLQKHAGFPNRLYTLPDELAYAAFDIIATEDSTVVQIYSPVDVDGHSALTQFSITLDKGETYSCGYTGAGHTLPANHPGGAVVISNKPIGVSIKDDSNNNPNGCFDLMGDQLVPVDIVGDEYVAVKGSLDPGGDESVFLTATRNNTKVYINGNSTEIATLFAGEVYRIDIDSLDTSPNNAIHIRTSLPAYAMHITGFGCEMGQAILPPLNCAGSQQVSFVRSTSESFFLTLLVRAVDVNNFVVNGPGTATINAGSFLTVPGTGGEWMAAKIQYNTTEVPVDSTIRVSNTSDVFALGLINGGGSSGCRYGYFSEFQSETFVDAGTNKTPCANTVVGLSGVVGGSTLKGIWSTPDGSGTFSDTTDLNATYFPSNIDTLIGLVTLILKSDGPCFPKKDTITLNFTPAPYVNAGLDQTVCGLNPSINLTGSVTVAAGGQWSGGAGSYNPSDLNLFTTYTPTGAEIVSGQIKLALTSIGNGTCNAEADTMLITFTTAPIVDADIDQTNCFNDLSFNLNGNVSGGTTTGRWSTGGTGTFTPNDSALNAVYTASSADSATGLVTLTLNSTNNGTCSPGTDDMKINILPFGTADPGNDTTFCANIASIPLNGVISGGASGGVWSSAGSGTFTPYDSILNASYIPSDTDRLNGNVILRLTANSCDSYTDSILITFVPAPFTDAGTDILTCVDSLDVLLAGNITGSTTTGVWSTLGTGGTFSPSDTILNATYNASSSDSLAGSVQLVLLSTNNGSCPADVDTMTINIIQSGIVNAGSNDTVCANNIVLLNGSISGGASKGIWTTSGSGTFIPSDTVLNASYIFSNADTLAGTVTLTLTATNSCNVVSNNMTVLITDGPIVDAGTNQTVCANNPSATFNASYTISGGLKWSGGNGTYAPNDSAINMTYTPTAGEIISGSVILYTNTTGNKDCIAETDSVILTITPAPIVDASVDQSVCKYSTSTLLNGSVSGGASTGKWSTTNGSGSFFPNDSVLAAAYIVGPGDTTLGTIELILSATNFGNCIVERDTMTITFGPAASVYAGVNIAVCNDNMVANLNGIITGGSTTGKWSTIGLGTFAPNDSTLNATYTLDAIDSTNGFVDLILTSTNNGACTAGTDTTRINLEYAHTANAGTDQTVCPGSSVILSGSITNAVGAIWTTAGSGTFFPNDSALNAQYTPGNIDSILGGTVLTLTTINSGACATVNNKMNVLIQVPIDADFLYSSACLDQDMPFTDNTTVFAGSISQWKWVFEDSFVVFSQNAQHTYTQLGNQNVKLIVTSSLGCLDSVIKTVDINEVPNVGFKYRYDCWPDSVQFTDTSSISTGLINQWYWDFGDGDTLYSTLRNPNYKYLLSGNYDVMLRATTSDGCSDTEIVQVTVDPSVIADFTFDTIAFMYAKELITFTNASSGETSWLWNFGDGSGVSTNPSPNYVYSEGGDYVVKLVVSNDNGCKDSLSTDLVVFPEKVILPPEIPSAFSPNDDGENDTLYLRGGPFVEIEFKVYNQWGEMIFETTDQNIGWSGFRKNKEQPTGLYSYTVIAVSTEETFRKSGSVILMR